VWFWKTIVAVSKTINDIFSMIEIYEGSTLLYALDGSLTSKLCMLAEHQLARLLAEHIAFHDELKLDTVSLSLQATLEEVTEIRQRFSCTEIKVALGPSHQTLIKVKMPRVTFKREQVTEVYLDAQRTELLFRDGLKSWV
jgi:hypothetical protein